MKKISDDFIVITFSDLKNIFLRHRAKIKMATLLCGFVVLSLLLLREPKYLAEATFKQSGSTNEMSKMKELVQDILVPPKETAQTAILQSNEVLKDAVEELGMQIVCNPHSSLVSGMERIVHNLFCELGGKLADLDSFIFRKVTYTGEKPLSLQLKLTGRDTFQLYDKQKKLIGEGKVGTPFFFDQAAFTLHRIPQSSKEGNFYALKIHPWIQTVEKIRKKFVIRPFKVDKNILQLIFTSDDRFLAAQFLNQVMLSYQHFLKLENEEFSKDQLAYLEKREGELISHFDQALSEHAKYLRENLSKNGFIGFAQEMETLSEPKNLYTSQLYNLDIEIERLHKIKKPSLFNEDIEKPHEIILPNFHAKKELQMRLETCDLEQRREEKVSNRPLTHEIDQIRNQVTEAKLLVENIENEKEISSLPSLFNDQKSLLVPLIKQMSATASEKEQNNAPKVQALSYLHNFIDTLEQKQSLLEEDLLIQTEGSTDFNGLTLSTAQHLLTDYIQQRDNLQAQMRELVFIRDRLSMPHFELSSLGVIFNDGITNDLVQKASNIALQLKDDNNRSLREQERLLEALETQKNYLSQYLFQTIELKKLKGKLLDDKIASLHQTTVQLLNSEKELLKQKLDEINVKMADLPEKWRRESLLLLKKEMGALMIEGVSQLAESKYINQNLFQASSRPLDRALPPIQPKKPRILLLSFLAAVLGGFFCFFVITCRNLLKGFPASHENLKLSGFPISGTLSRRIHLSLSQVQEKDLETLRHISEFLASHSKAGEAMTAVCIGGKYPDYSLPLAELLSMRGLKVLIIQHVLNPSEDNPGLWQYLNGQMIDLPLQRHLTHDYLPSGKTTSHEAEMIHHPKFRTLLSQMKPNYDIILLFSSSDASKADAFSLLKFADAVVVTVQQEIKDELLVYCDWAEKKGANCTTFVYAEEF